MATTPGSRIADVKDGADTEKAMAASLEQFTRDYGEEEASHVLIGTPLTAAAVVYVIVLLVLLLCVIFASLGTAWAGDLCLSVD